ncbi:hypothetical protein CMUS01_10506 [Colletotrichum musicola]|uniref:Uncharacterized protein n=1 Tax=Colletotrichum musicola TaxID=2175873 RepID=A0A8H6K3L7_9PEZI|nr:hypothetical protein CMUS01_10506 [Colletotrichum musicola]
MQSAVAGIRDLLIVSLVEASTVLFTIKTIANRPDSIIILDFTALLLTTGFLPGQLASPCDGGLQGDIAQITEPRTNRWRAAAPPHCKSTGARWQVSVSPAACQLLLQVCPTACDITAANRHRQTLAIQTFQFDTEVDLGPRDFSNSNPNNWAIPAWSSLALLVARRYGTPVKTAQSPLRMDDEMPVSSG